ncbi:MAG: hypothetical protein ACRD4B_08860 [Acidobacteriota bacterium]
MNSHIIVDGKPLKLNRFVTELNGNLLDAVARSLKFTDGKQIRFRLSQGEIAMHIDDKQVSLDLGHASQIVRDVLTGLLKNLYGAENATEVLFICER